ncbi:MAG: hypothetical protein ACHQO8_05150 [Vicinamibacterales bacterium]
MRLSYSNLIGGIVGCALVGFVADDGLAAAVVAVLLIGWTLVATHDGLFVVPLAFMFHWLETSLGVLYLDFTGRQVPTVYDSDYRPMVLIGLGCCLAIAIGFRLGLSLIKAPKPHEERAGFAFPFSLLLTVYLATVFFEGTIVAVAADFGSFRQILVTIDTARLGVLFLILRRLLHPEPRWGLMALVVFGEVILGITGFFAGFREPVVLAALAMLEVFDRRRASHWLALGAAGVFAVGLGLVWMGIRAEYRRDYVELDNFQTSRSARVDRVTGLATDWFKTDAEGIWSTADSMVDRLWPIYYPALALKRVPEVLPHTNGEILGAALLHIVTPRVFFPNKPDLQSDSEKVRKYANVMVAGAEENTSIAFGYAAEAYIDFGVPLMFVPVLGFGFALGACYALFRKLIWHRELFVAFATVTFWLSMYLFERSWATLLGVALGFMVYLGVPTLVFDRVLYYRYVARLPGREASPIPDDPLRAR